MKKIFKLKINGESPRSLLLAFVFAKLKFDVYIYDFSSNSNSKKDYQIFLFSNSTKNFLSKFDIWNELKDISYGFNSLIFRDNLISDQLLLRTENSPKKYLNTIGWAARYSEIKRVLINKLMTYKNVQFISKNQLIDQTLIFDYEFNFNNFDSILNSFKFPLSTFKRLDKQLLIFNVYLRGQVEKRLYEINTTEGLLVLTPINKNFYQIIWNDVSFQIKKTSSSSKSLFLDYLTTLLPNELKIDQIIGDIKFLQASNIYLNCLIKNKSIYFNENKFKSNTLYDFNFDIIMRNILQIYFLENKEFKGFKKLNIFKFSNLLSKYKRITLDFSLINYLLYLFKKNNIFLLILRKLLFTLFNRVNSIKILFNKNLIISNNNNQLK